MSRRSEAYEKTLSDEDKAEYFLTIEGFLLHFRNLLGFFINKGNQDSDLTIARSERWADGQTVDKKFCDELTERAKYAFSPTHLCYQKISWFLGHCTDYRYREQRSWDLPGMFADFGPIVDEFIATFAPERPGAFGVTAVLAHDNYGTATMTSSGIPAGLGDFSYKSIIPRLKPRGDGSKS